MKSKIKSTKGRLTIFDKLTMFNDKFYLNEQKLDVQILFLFYFISYITYQSSINFPLFNFCFFQINNTLWINFVTFILNVR